jgi:hypothetical protein
MPIFVSTVVCPQVRTKTLSLHGEVQQNQTSFSICSSPPTLAQAAWTGPSVVAPELSNGKTPSPEIVVADAQSEARQSTSAQLAPSVSDPFLASQSASVVS